MHLAQSLAVARQHHINSFDHFDLNNENVLTVTKLLVT